MIDMPTDEEVLEAWTKEVRYLYIVGRAEADGVLDQNEVKAEFDAWLAEVKAGVWDEGAEMGHRLYAEPMSVIEDRNPYREEKS